MGPSSGEARDLKMDCWHSLPKPNPTLGEEICSWFG